MVANWSRRNRERSMVWAGCLLVAATGSFVQAQDPVLENLPPLEVQSVPLPPTLDWPPTSTAPVIRPRPAGSSVQVMRPTMVYSPQIVEEIGAPIVVDRPLLGLAEQLVFEIDDFVLNFGPQVASVPDGRKILNDAEKLRIQAIRFRDAVRVANFDHISKLYKMLRVESNDLVRRVSRVSRGRSGPNVQRVGMIAATTARMGSMLR